MPVVTDKPSISAITQKQNNCNICNELSPRNKHIATCSICTMWMCLQCTNIPEAVLKAASTAEAKLHIVCEKCEVDLPKIRNLLTIQKEQEKMKIDIKTLQTDVSANQTLITTCNNEHESINTRLEAVESILNLHKLSDKDFPLLSTVVAGTQKLQVDLTAEKVKTTGIGVALKKQQADKEEQQRREAKKTSLIVYGIKEIHTEDKTAQMKADFNTIVQLYSDRLEILGEDFSQISRVGNHKPGQIRPIKITCINMEKRNKILTNNKGLKMYDDDYEDCTSCNSHGKHVHVYVTTDKTK